MGQERPKVREVSGLDAYLDVEERDSKKIEPKNFRNLASYILKHPGPLVAGMGMVLLGTGAALLEPRIFGYAIDEAIVPKRWDLLVRYSWVFLVVIILRVIAAIAQSYLFELLGQRVCLDLRMALFSHLQRLPVAVYDKNPAGRLLTRVTNDIGSLNEMFSAGFVSMASNLLMVIGILVWLVILDVRLGLIAASVFPIMVALSIYFSARLKVAYRESRSKLSALNAFLAENIMGMKVVHLFNRQKLHMDRFDRINEWYADAQMGTVRVFALFQPAITWFSGLAMALVIWYGGLASAEGTLPLGVLVAYFSYVMALFQPVREIADKWNIFLSGMASAERIFSILAWPVEIESAETPVSPLADLRGHIVFENVWFAYDGEHWVLRDFSLELKPGMRVGIVGHTGAGKTTLISLLMRFYEPQRGRILLDGRDIREYDRRELRASIGIIQQDVFLFSGSHRDNVTFWECLRNDAVPGVLKELGYEHWWSDDGAPILERGVNMSMGQRQVMAFVRAFAAKPRIWILDEATANMDSETEIKLQAALSRAASGRTLLMIAHRLSTVKTADLILVLHKGVLVEKGNHDDLVQLDGLYARLYRYQEGQEGYLIPV